MENAISEESKMEMEESEAGKEKESIKREVSYNNYLAEL